MRIPYLLFSLLLVGLAPLSWAQGLDATSSANEASEPAMGLKKKVAIARFSNETKSGNSFLINKDGDRLGKQASDILSARLTDSGKFLMFERIDSEKMSTEQMLAGMSESGISVDYLIVGSVSEFGRSTTSDTGLFSRSREQKAYAKVNVRLVEVSTGRIVHAEEGAGEATVDTKTTMGVGSSAGFDQSISDKAISAAISQLITNLMDNMLASPWKSYLLAKEDDLFILAGGPSQGITEGLSLKVMKNGRQVKNPQTGAVIQLPGKQAAVVTVVATHGNDEFNEVSFVEVSEGTIEGDLANYTVEAL
jgi:curli biogenesis system outer membrane secretion channel CsgG